MDPYYVSAGKIAHVAATNGLRPSSLEKTTTTATGVASFTPSVEGSVAYEVVAASPDLSSPSVALGLLTPVLETLKPLLIDPADPSLGQGEWFRLVGNARFAVLHRDSGGDGDPIATWFLEVVNDELQIAYWVVLTGSPGHLREEWSGSQYANRSGSRTDTVFDALKAATGVPLDRQWPDEDALFYATSSMAGMALHSHLIETVAEVKHVWPSNGRANFSSRGPERLPIARIVVASPLFVQKYRPRDERVEPEAPAIPSPARPRWRRWLAWLGF